ncbi:MAG: carboxypeptidase regulatory-like domain-containing protein [Victivallales bacterium]|nr:carboxypeptidase regulatory-like domain-containing protein [Victivallales bacterium]
MNWKTTFTALFFSAVLLAEMDAETLKFLKAPLQVRPTHQARKIYGRVVDQHGDGVPGACVSISHAPSFTKRVRLRALTDRDGFWECMIPPSYIGGSPSLHRIQKYGYEWQDLEDEKKMPNYPYIDPYRNARMWLSTTPEKRFVSTMRKKAPPTYTIKRKGGRKGKFGLNGKRPDGYYNYLSGNGTYADDRRELFNMGDSYSYFSPPVAEETLAYDLQFHAERRADGCGWTLLVTPNGEKAGILLWQVEDFQPPFTVNDGWKGRVHEAPEEGYQPSLVIPIDDGVEAKHTLCTRTRHFPLYAEVRLSIYASTAEQADAESGPWLNVQLESVTYNPFGKRSLEMDEALSYSFFPESKEGRDEWERFKKLCLSFRDRLFLNILPDESELERFRHIPDYYHDPTTEW